MSYFKAKMHQIRFRLRIRPRPRWESSQRSPYPLPGFMDAHSIPERTMVMCAIFFQSTDAARSKIASINPSFRAAVAVA